jgi:hypothetical protein
MAMTITKAMAKATAKRQWQRYWQRQWLKDNRQWHWPKGNGNDNHKGNGQKAIAETITKAMAKKQ